MPTETKARGPKLDEATCRRICEAMGVHPEARRWRSRPKVLQWYDTSDEALAAFESATEPVWKAVQRAAEEQSPSPSPSRGE